MPRLTLTEFLLTIILVCAIAFGLSQLLQTWLLSTTAQTTSRIERAGEIFR